MGKPFGLESESDGLDPDAQPSEEFSRARLRQTKPRVTEKARQASKYGSKLLGRPKAPGCGTAKT